MNDGLAEELKVIAHNYQKNAMVCIRNSKADKDTKNLVEDVLKDTHNVLITFASKIAETK